MKSTIFLTGATGLVGGTIALQILKNIPGAKLFLLVRGNSQQEASSRLWKTLLTIDPEMIRQNLEDRIEIMRGDITVQGLGLSREDMYRVVSESTHILHCAASVEFNLPLSEARRINCGGTRNILEVAKMASRSGRLQRFGYVSTAYVSGRREGTVYESELDHSSGFANTYEQSKFEAEKLVLASGNEVPFFILRPSIVVGDSRNGITTSFNVLYTPLRFIFQGFIRALPGSPNIPLDVVPVDFLAEAICHIMLKAENVLGRTFHLTAGLENLCTTGEIVALAVNHFNESANGHKVEDVEFLAKNSRPGALSSVARQNLAARMMAGYESYICINRVFDNGNTMAALEGTGIHARCFKEYYRVVLQYFIQSCLANIRRAA